MKDSLRAPLLFIMMLVLVLPGCASNRVKESANEESPAVINAKLGLGYLRQGNYDVALSKLEKALQQDPKLPMAHHYIAEVYRQTGSYELAGEHFERALKLDSHDPLLQNNYGVFLCDQKRYKEAEQRFLKVIAMPTYKRPDEAYENAGLCALRIPDLVKAEKYFRQALDINPKLSTSLYHMAQLNFDAHEYLKARAFLERYFAVAGHTAQTLWLGIKTEHELGDSVALTQYNRLLLDNFPDSEEAQLARRLTQSP